MTLNPRHFSLTRNENRDGKSGSEEREKGKEREEEADCGNKELLQLKN